MKSLLLFVFLIANYVCFSQSKFEVQLDAGLHTPFSVNSSLTYQGVTTSSTSGAGYIEKKESSNGYVGLSALVEITNYFKAGAGIEYNSFNSVSNFAPEVIIKILYPKPDLRPFFRFAIGFNNSNAVNNNYDNNGTNHTGTNGTLLDIGGGFNYLTKSNYSIELRCSYKKLNLDYTAYSSTAPITADVKNSFCMVTVSAGLIYRF